MKRNNAKFKEINPAQLERGKILCSREIVGAFSRLTKNPHQTRSFLQKPHQNTPAYLIRLCVETLAASILRFLSQLFQLDEAAELFAVQFVYPVVVTADRNSQDFLPAEGSAEH